MPRLDMNCGVCNSSHNITHSCSVPMASGMSQIDPRQLLESLPTHNLPPFLTSLVSSLQHLKTQCHVSDEVFGELYEDCMADNAPCRILKPKVVLKSFAT